MQTQLVLFLRPAEMLIFNSLFDSIAKGKKGGTISLTRQNFEKLRQAVNEAQGEASAEKFIEDCVTAIAENGLIERVERKSANLPIGVWRAQIVKDMIIGPDYIVEKGFFKIIVPGKLQPAPSLSPATVAECPNKELIDFNQILKHQYFRDSRRVDVLVIFVGFSPWAESWFSLPEFFSFLERRTNSCPLTLSKTEELLLAHSRTRRNPFLRNNWFPREDIKFRLSRFGMQRFFELMKLLNR